MLCIRNISPRDILKCQKLTIYIQELEQISLFLFINIEAAKLYKNLIFPLIQLQILNQILIQQYYFSMQEQKKIALPKRIKGKHLSTFKDYNIDTNYYTVKVYQKIEQIYIYKIVFTPFIPHDNSKQKLALLQSGMKDIREFIPSPVISGSNILSTKAPAFKGEEKEREIIVDAYVIKIRLVKKIPVRDNPKALLMFLNNGLRNMFNKIGYTEIGKSGKFFKVSSPQNIDNELKMFSGFKANFMWLQKGIYLRVDSAKKIVRNQTVLDFINEVYQKNKNKDRDEKRIALKSELNGKIIMTNYGKVRYLRVTDVVFQFATDVKISGTDTTLVEFYRTKYNKKIQNEKQPLIEVESKQKKEGDRTLLIPQLCLMTGIPDNFDEFKRKKISQRTIKNPAEKKKDIEEFMRQAEKVNDLSSLKQIGIQISNKLNQVKAKLIPSPKLQLGNGRSVQSGKQANFQLFRDQIFDTKHSVKCGIFTYQNADVGGLIDTFKNTARNLGVKFEQDIYTSKQNDKSRILSSYFSQIHNAIRKKDINIALIVIPGFMKSNYGQIKRQCLNKLNIVTQCVVDSTLRKKNLQSIATKLLLQMIAKRGNILWVPKTTGRINQAMVVAFDQAKGPGGNCIVCCATVNETFSSYYSKASRYSSDQDKFNEMVKLSMEAVNYYSKKNSRCPKELVMFHNSCTGDQVNLFRNFFLETLVQKLKDSSTGSSIPNISLVMVNTKTNQRFFTTDNKNVNAGTIVADEIVSENYDFYLVSQGSNRGTTVPNHYKVVYTNSNIQEGLLHELAFSQCFNYVNWTGSIKIPGILQYAKKCAKFTADALEGSSVKEDLDCKLYFV